MDLMLLLIANIMHNDKVIFSKKLAKYACDQKLPSGQYFTLKLYNIIYSNEDSLQETHLCCQLKS